MTMRSAITSVSLAMSGATYLLLWWVTGLWWAFIIVVPLELWNFCWGHHCALRSCGKRCAICEGRVGVDKGPPDGWQLEDGRTVCHACCVRDTGIVIDSVINGARQ